MIHGLPPGQGDRVYMDYSKLKLDRKSTVPLYEQLLVQLSDTIEAGELAIGTRLPSERKLATMIDISRTTVVHAYRELEARGYLRGYVGRGTFVCAATEVSYAPLAWRDKLSLRSYESNNPVLSLLRHATNNPETISLAARAAAADIFPHGEFQRLTALALGKYRAEVLGIGAPEGLQRLRKTISAYMGTRRERVH